MFLDFPVSHAVLVMPGFCKNCLTESALPASKRIYHLNNKTKQQSYIQRHINALKGSKSVKCGLQAKQYASTFDSIRQFQFHPRDAQEMKDSEEILLSRHRKITNLTKEKTTHPSEEEESQKQEHKRPDITVRVRLRQRYFCR